MVAVNTQAPADKRLTARDLRRFARKGERFAMLTCYDATTARLLAEAGVRCLLVGDTAAQFMLGYDATIHAPLDYMVTITAAVRRGAPTSLVMADMPFGSYQCGDDAAVANAMRFLTEGQADLVKFEFDASFVPLAERLVHAGVPVVAHIGSRPQQVRADGGYSSAGRTQRQADQLVELAKQMVGVGVTALLVEAIPDAVSKRIVEIAKQPGSGRTVPVIGCGAGPSCHGHVVVIHDVLGLTDWQPPFAPLLADGGDVIRDAAKRWRGLIESGQYMADGGPYTMRD